MLTLASDLWKEIRGFPHAIASAAAGYRLSHNFATLHHREDIAIHLHGGTAALPDVYHPWRNHLLSHLENSPRVHLPRRIIVRASHLAEYSAMIPNETNVLEIDAGHSAGGFIGIRRALSYPDRMLRLILVGTPIHPEHVHPWAKKNVGERILGIDANHLPPYLEDLRAILSNPKILALTTVIASKNDKFFPPEACHIEGAEYIEIEHCSHVGFIYEASALDAIHSVIARALKPHTPRRLAA